MPRYLFSNDQRISVLADRIQWVADYVLSGITRSKLDFD